MITAGGRPENRNTDMEENFKTFISEHENDDITSILLSRDKWKGIDIDLAVNTIYSRRRLKAKAPSWYSDPELIYPNKISAEQCSSEDTAFYKAHLAERLLDSSHRGRREAWRIADLTGGLGIDSWAFSKIAGKVLYNEMDPGIASAAEHNFKTLGADNISVSRHMVTPAAGEEGLTGLTPSLLLGDFRPDLIFIDPARRSDDGKKVFLIEDCRPDVLTLKEELLSLARFLMVKLSPMADIGMALDRLGSNCSELHIVSSGGECKELLVVMDREWEGDCSIKVAGTLAGKCRISGEEFSFLRKEEKDASPTLPASREQILSAGFLFEPGKAMLKSGAFNLICRHFGLVKMARSTHLYLLPSAAGSGRDENGRTETGLSLPGQEQTGKLPLYGKVFRIREALPLGNRTIKETGKRYPRAEVTARNIPMTSELLRKKLGVSSGGALHIFGAGCEFSGRKEAFLFITESDSSKGIHP